MATKTTFYFLRINGQNGPTLATKRAAITRAKRLAKANPTDRVSVWFRDIVGQHIPVNWREEPKPQPDIIVEGDGSVWIVRGMTDAGYQWVEDKCSNSGYQPFGLGARLVEHRYVGAIVEGAAADGLRVRVA